MDRPKSYAVSVFLLIASFVWIVTFVIAGLFYYRENVFKAEGLNGALQTASASALRALESGQQPSQVARAMRSADGALRVTILDRNGVVLYDTGGVPAGTDHSDRHEVALAMAGGAGYTLSRQSATGGDYFYSARSDGGDYIVRASLPHNPILDGRLEGETDYLLVAVLMSLVLTVVAFFAARRMGRMADDRLAATRRQLVSEEQERSRMKARLTANINHELKNPVHALRACLDTLADNADRLTPEMTQRLCQSGRDEACRLSALIDDIGTLTRLSEADDAPVEKEAMDLRDILDQIQGYVASLPPGRAMRLHVEVPQSLPANGNPSLLASVFRNLVDNALQHSSGRDIWIKLEAETPEAYKFSVSDNGIGIPEEHRGRVFERFYRVDAGRSRASGGTGLGLAIVKNALGVHGGKITAGQRSGGGARFTFTLSKGLR